jgi:hypothetical protein
VSKTFTAVCPKCNETVEIPYKYVARDMGSRSVLKRRKDDPHFALNMSRNRWGGNYLHPKQQALLDLAKTEDLNNLTYKQMAEKIGITGRWQVNAAWHHVERLRQKGLLTLKKRIVIADDELLHPKQQAIFALSRTEDLSTLTDEEIADRVGIIGENRVHDVGYHIKQLSEKGLLPVRE